MLKPPTGTVTLLFTDIEGSTRLLQRLGDQYPAVLVAHQQLLQAAFQRYSGYEVHTEGDSFFVAFGRAGDALKAAVAAQQALAAHPWPEGGMVRVRMGLHTGEPIWLGNDYTGLDVHRTARLCSAGHGGQILLSQSTAVLVERDLPEGVALRDVGTHRLKDLLRPEQIFQLVAADLSATFPSLKTLDARLTNLPLQATALIGRTHEIASTRTLIQRDDVRLLTLTGPGGTGKTRLALQVAAESLDAFADGVYFVALAPISDPELVATTIAQTLGVTESSSQPLLARLKDHLHAKQLLLVLDNFEQVLAAAPLVAELLAAAPAMKVLVTSRAVLHLYGEREVAVAPLALPDTKHLPSLDNLTQYDAVRLFIERAQAVRMDFSVTNANAPAVAEICVRLDGLPLAIELAAARSKLFAPQALLARLDKRLKLLTGGARDLPTRQQALRSTIDWSYNLLTAGEQTLFRRFGVFVGGCSLEAAEAVCTAEADLLLEALEGLESLVGHSLLQQQAGANGEPRFLMLETIKEYALEQLVASGEEPELLQRHAHFFMQLAETAEAHFSGPGQRTWVLSLEAEHDNLRAALTWSIGAASEMGLRLAGALGRFWDVQGHHREGRDWLLKALAQSKDDHRVQVKSARAKALNQAGYLAAFQYELTQAQSLFEQSVALWREVGDPRGLAYALCDWGAAASFQSGSADNFQGTLRQARSRLEESISIFRQLAEKKGLARALFWHGLIASFQSDDEIVRASSEACIELSREVGDISTIAAAKGNLVDVAFRHGDYAAAQSLCEESLQLYRDVGDTPGIALIGGCLGSLAYLQGNYELAKQICEECLQTWRELGIQHQVAWVIELLGYISLRQNDYKHAAAHFEASLALWAELHETHDIARCLAGLAHVAEAAGQMERAARLLGATAALMEASSTNFNDTEQVGNGRIPITNQSDYERHVAAVRATLGDKAFAAAWAAGRALSLEQAIAEAMTVSAEVERAPSVPPAIPTAMAPASYPAGLTEREVEILRLVAQGLTDAQVAERLVISPRTVQGHLRSIYGKLEVTSRTAATRFAIEHNLI